MKLGSFKLFTAAIICAAAVSLTISSCDSNNSPTTPGSNGGVDRGKGPQVLDGRGVRLVGSSNDPEGRASISADENGDLTVSGLNEESGSGIATNFDAPVTNWNTAASAEFAADGGSLALEARGDDGKMQARFDIRTQNGVAVTYPTFTSNPDGGRAMYDVYVYNNGGLVGSQLDVDAAQSVKIYYPASCTLKLVAANWSVVQVSSQCVWKYGLNPCCVYQFQLPDGTIINGNEIKFVEKNEKGVYVYLQTKSGWTTGTSVNVSTKASAAFSALQ